MNSRKPRVAVFFGGEKGSHDLSMETGWWVSQYLPRGQYQVVPVHITEEGLWQVPLGSLPQRGPVRRMMQNLFSQVRAVSPAKGLERLLKTPVRAAMTVLRGRGGDDGSLHGLSKSLSIPMVGSGQAACHAASDKYVCAQRLGDIVSAPATLHYDKSRRWQDIVGEVRDEMAPPLFIKPVHQEASVGVVSVDSSDELTAAVKHGLLDDDVLIQQRTKGQELCVTIFDDERGGLHVLPSAAVVPKVASFYDHLAKRRGGRVGLEMVGGEDNPLFEEAEGIAREVYAELNCQGLVTVDLIVGDTATEILDVNTIPTFSQFTPLQQQLKAGGVRPSALFGGLMRRSLEEG